MIISGKVSLGVDFKNLRTDATERVVCNLHYGGKSYILQQIKPAMPPVHLLGLDRFKCGVRRQSRCLSDVVRNATLN